MQQLIIGTLLRGGSYKIEKVLGQGYGHMHRMPQSSTDLYNR